MDCDSFFRLLVECFTKYCVVGEAIRHFRALTRFEGGTKVLHHEGNFGDPLSLYLRALCREGTCAFLYIFFWTSNVNFLRILVFSFSCISIYYAQLFWHIWLSFKEIGLKLELRIWSAVNLILPKAKKTNISDPIIYGCS